MAVLRNVFFGILIIVLLSAAKWMLDRYSAISSGFHDLMIVDYRLLILGLIVLSGVFRIFSDRRQIPSKYLILTTVICLFVLDFIFYEALRHPSAIPAFARQTAKRFYTDHERNIIQYDPCSEYDSSFFYRLRPDTSFSFSNIEFDTRLSTNVEGMRDTDSALSHPEIICLGDSYTLGWGVSQQQGFAAMLGRLKGKRVLNTAMASYGTAREIKWLTKLDTDSLKYVVLQYCRNDVQENMAFQDHDSVLPISSPETYEAARQDYQWRKKYFPGKYALSITHSWLREKISQLVKGAKRPYYLSEDPVASAAVFVHVLDHIQIDPRKTKLILIDLNDYSELSSRFIHAVDSVVAEPAHRAIRGALKTIDLSGELLSDDYYVLDAHLKPSGHAKVARILAQYIDGSQ